GGLRVRGEPNPFSRRTGPWGEPSSIPANVKDTGGGHPAPGDGNPGGVRAPGVLDLPGNRPEGTRGRRGGGCYAGRGCSWGMCLSRKLPTVLAIPNPRAMTFKYFELGFRCVVE